MQTLQRLLVKFREEQEGSIFVSYIFIFLGTMMAILIFCSLFVFTFQNYKVDSIVERAVELRAQSIDIPLKEGFGLIEVLHPSHAAGYEGEDNDLELGDGYTYQLLSPSDFRYVANMDDIDNTIKSSIVEQINAIGDNTLKTTKDDICIKVLPLPEGKGKKMDVSCTFEDGNTETRSMYVDGLDHSSNIKGNYQVKNAVAIFVKYDIEKKMSTLFSKESVKHSVAVKLGYPLIEDSSVRSN